MSSGIFLEICIDSLDSARAAIKGGADRLEVCSSLAVGGGLTPSFGLVQLILDEYPDFPVMVMIRPRMGDFLYSDAELEVMKADIQHFKTLKVHGFVFGVLRANGRVDVERTRTLVTATNDGAAKPYQITFHRAFDLTPNAEDAYLDLSGLGITRILTSGHCIKVSEGLETVIKLRTLATEAGPTLLPGSGINLDTIASAVRSLWPQGIREYHLSASAYVEGGVELSARKSGMGMGVGRAEWGTLVTDEEIVRAVKKAAQQTVKSLLP